MDLDYNDGYSVGFDDGYNSNADYTKRIEALLRKQLCRSEDCPARSCREIREALGMSVR